MAATEFSISACNAYCLITHNVFHNRQSWDYMSLPRYVGICINSLALYLFVYMLPSGIYMWNFDGPARVLLRDVDVWARRKQDESEVKSNDNGSQKQ